MPRKDTTTDNIAAAVHHILGEQLPKLVDAVHGAGRKGALSVAITLTPDKELPGRYELTITPKLALPGVGASWGSSIRVAEGGAVQLSLLSEIEPAA